MLPFLPELPATPAAPLSPSTALPAQAGTGGRGPGGGMLDFAGLLDAAMPAAVTIAPEASVPEAEPPALPALPGALPVSVLVPGLRGLPDLPETGVAPAPETLAEPLPTGTILPESGTALPLAEPVMPAAALPVPAEPQAAGDTPDSAPTAPVDDGETDDPPLVQGLALPVPPAALAPVAVASPPVPPANLAAAAPNQRAAMPVATQTVPRAVTAPRAPMPTLAPVAAEAPASRGETADPSAMLADLSGSAPAPAPVPAATPANPAPLAQAAPAPVPPAVIEQRPDPRAPAVSQESTIAQVGEIREALRSVRPEMTLRHAEFGLVSLRIEGTAAAAQDWRAVLASRDPGFVPAVQAALAERAVAPAADTASTGSQTGSGGNSGGSSDRSYGFSQGSGQGSSQPYLEHSGKRDEGASQHQRQQQRGDEAALAAAPDAGPADARERGLFA